jgi:predicted Zn-dependent peptidase
VQVIPTFPGGKYESLFVFFGVPSQGVSPEKIEEEIYAEIDRIKNEGITQEELERAKTRARADLIGQLDSNTGLAQQLSRMEALTGDWRSVFQQLDKLEAVTAADVQRVANETFTRDNRTVGMIKTQDGSPTADASGSE